MGDDAVVNCVLDCGVGVQWCPRRLRISLLIDLPHLGREVGNSSIAFENLFSTPMILDIDDNL